MKVLVFIHYERMYIKCLIKDCISENTLQLRKKKKQKIITKSVKGKLWNLFSTFYFNR